MQIVPEFRINNIPALVQVPSHYLNQLEQLERLHSEIPPTAPWLPILVVHIRSQVKNRQSQSYKFEKNCQKFKLYMRHTFWSCLIRCINIKWIQLELQALQSGHRMRDGQTNGRTEWNQYTPQQLHGDGVGWGVGEGGGRRDWSAGIIIMVNLLVHMSLSA